MSIDKLNIESNKVYCIVNKKVDQVSPFGIVRWFIFVCCLVSCSLLWVVYFREQKFEYKKISSKNAYMVDKFGRVRIFHGFNSVSKSFPWFKDDLLNTTRIDLYKSWGFNVVRLGVIWSGAQPESGPNGFNNTYLIQLEKAIRLLSVHDIYVILDMHQDVLSSKFNAYDALPIWIVDKMPPPRHKYPWPLPTVPGSASWARGYFAEAVSEAFQNLYSNISGTLEDWGMFWRRVASQYGKYDHVLGYELINEPWAGNIYNDPSLLLPFNAGKINLLPAYNYLNSIIRQVDTETLLFYEPVTWAIFNNGHYFGTGFDTVPGGKEYQNRSVLSFHYYCWLLDIEKQQMPYSWKDKLICDEILAPNAFQNVVQSIGLTGGSSFLTEFGLCEPNDDKSSMGTIECESVLNLADAYFQSWTYWDSQFFNADDGSVRWSTTRPFARVYPQAIAGIPIKITFDVNEKTFYFKFMLNLSIEKPTEIFIPEVHYPTGFAVTVSDGLKWSFNENSRLLLVWPSNMMKRKLCKTQFISVIVTVSLND